MSSLKQALGLAAKAGRVKSGDFTVEKILKSGQTKLILLDTEASAATEERYTRTCERLGVRLMRVTGLGEAIGNPGRIVAAVTDRGFEQMIVWTAQQPSGDNEWMGAKN